jgi:GntR family transcriptional regulator
MGAPLVEVDFRSSIPAYRQIADGIRAHCVSGRLEPGTQLPTVRQLAQDLGLHFNTVAQAYRLLSQEGWLDLRRRRGAMVVHRDRPRNPDPRRMTDMLKRVRTLAVELRGEGLSTREIALVFRKASQGVK